MTTKEAIARVHALYCKAYEKCIQARNRHMNTITIQATKSSSFRLVIGNEAYGKTACHRAGMLIPDWASNVVYRLVEECLVPDLSSDDIDVYFSRLHAVGYDVEI